MSHLSGTALLGGARAAFQHLKHSCFGTFSDFAIGGPLVGCCWLHDKNEARAGAIISLSDIISDPKIFWGLDSVNMLVDDRIIHYAQAVLSSRSKPRNLDRLWLVRQVQDVKVQ